MTLCEEFNNLFEMDKMKETKLTKEETNNPSNPIVRNLNLQCKIPPQNFRSS